MRARASRCPGATAPLRRHHRKSGYRPSPPRMTTRFLGEVHARIPMPTGEEQRALQLENTRQDARFWEGIHNMHGGMIEGHKGIIAHAEKTIANGEAQRAEAAAEMKAVNERIAHIERCE